MFVVGTTDVYDALAVGEIGEVLRMVRQIDGTRLSKWVVRFISRRSLKGVSIKPSPHSDGTLFNSFMGAVGYVRSFSRQSVFVLELRSVARDIFKLRMWDFLT